MAGSMALYFCHVPTRVRLTQVKRPIARIPRKPTLKAALHRGGYTPRWRISKISRAGRNAGWPCSATYAP